MSRAAKRGHLNRLLNSQIQSVLESFKIFDGPASLIREKVRRSAVMKAVDDIYKQATITGMLWSGGTPDVKLLENNITTYCTILQGFIFLCHGSTVGAGPTLFFSVRASAKQVIDRSISLLKDPILLSHGSKVDMKNILIPHLSGSVWEACGSLKKLPSSDTLAVGRAMIQVAISMKDVLREMKELKLATSESDDSNILVEEDDEFGSDLSHEEMKNAQLVISVVSDSLSVIKELIRFVTVMIKQRNHDDDVDTLEGLLKHCQKIGSQIDDLGACVFPPQEAPLMKQAAIKLTEELEGMKSLIVNGISGSFKDFIIASEGLKSSLTKFLSEIVSLDRLVNEMGNLDL
ncbi:hypothetical protein ZOSMA_460G00050 [Zostera marina]|uniref:Uncharacterized protein n=1 Tax=Zostera marina TaxID=29655 RepID=A0A0K9P2I3_ZOSMR|nr:hypothetical protein ZOSMA_460G00050 [Zostera marina]